MKKQIKVAYFPSDTPKNMVLGSNGKSLDKYCIKCEPEEAILKVLLDYGNEEFRISKVIVGTRYIDVVARQITIADSLTLWLEDVRPTELNGQSAVSWMLDKAEGRKEIQIISDIDTISTAYYKHMSLYKALHDNDNSFMKRWGGEIQRRGYTVYINKRIGTDRGFSIREGKNLTGFECGSNIDSLVTRARGQGFNGILGNYIDSPLIGSYNRIYTGVIKYEDVKVKGENNEEGYDTLEQAQVELDRRVNEEFSENGIDKIKASYNINFVQLEKTEEYKNYIAAERLFIGDDSRVYIPKLNIDIKVRAMTKKYDVLAQKTKEIKLSNYIEVKALSLKQITEKLESMDSTETILQIAKDNATALIEGGLKDSYVIVKENEIIIGDTKDINTMTKVWRWNNGGLGFSSTGYYGTFGTAITQDGAIVADFITTGMLNAALIKTGTMLADRIRGGVLESIDGSLQIDLQDTTKGIQFKKNGIEAIDIKGNMINFHDWEGTTRTTPVGQMFSSRADSNASKPELAISAGDLATLTFAYQKEDGTYGTYMRLDKNGLTGAEAPIIFFEDMVSSHNLRILSIDANNLKVREKITLPFAYLSDVNNITFFGGVEEFSIFGKNDRSMFAVADGEFAFRKNGTPYLYKDGTLDRINFDWDVLFTKNQHTNGNFTVTGTKNCVQKTKNYGDRLFYATEDAEPLLTDTGKAITKEVNGNYESIILIDNIFKESVDLSNYYVFLTKHGKGDIWIKEQTENYFIVESYNAIKFNWKIEAKRKGFENERLGEYINIESEAAIEEREVVANGKNVIKVN